MKLLKYVKEYRFPAIIGFVFKIAEAALELMVPLVMADIIDVGIKNNDQNYILVRGLFLVGLAVAGYLFALVCQYYASLTSQSVGTKLREDMYHQINRYDHHNLDKLSAPTLVTRLINDVVQIQLAVAMTIRLTSRAPFIMIGSLFLAFLISGPLASIFVVGAIVLAIVMLMITIISMPYFNNVQKKLDKISLIVRENLNGIRVIRAFASQDKEINKFKTETRQQKDIQVKVGRIQALLNPFTYLIVNVAIVLIVYFGGTEVNVGGLSQGEVIALVNYMNSILLALIVFANVLSIYNKAGASYTRIFEVLETEPAVVNDGQIQIYRESEDCIEFRHVSFAYEQKNVLNDLNFVPQYAALISGTIRENLQLGNQTANDQQLLKALEIAQGKEMLEDKAAGLDTVIEQGGKNLSGGQKQRLTIARALVKQPEILILDDSSSALDYATDFKLRQALKQLNMTKIIISQRTASIEQADKIMVLYHGDLVGFDSHEQLMKDCKIYQEIYASQHSKDGDDHE